MPSNANGISGHSVRVPTARTKLRHLIISSRRRQINVYRKLEVVNNMFEHIRLKLPFRVCMELSAFTISINITNPSHMSHRRPDVLA